MSLLIDPGQESRLLHQGLSGCFSSLEGDKDTRNRIIAVREQLLADTEAPLSSKQVVSKDGKKYEVVCQRDTQQVFVFREGQPFPIRIMPGGLMQESDPSIYLPLYKKLNEIPQLEGKHDVIIEIMKMRSSFLKHSFNVASIHVPNSSCFLRSEHEQGRIIIEHRGTGGNKTFIIISKEGEVFTASSQEIAEQAERDRMSKRALEVTPRSTAVEEDNSFKWSWDDFVAMVMSWIDKLCCSSTDDATPY